MNLLFINPYLTNEFTPVSNEIIKKINYNKTDHTKIISKINGFYGQIGPNPQFYNNNNKNYHLFDGDGMIHGVFFKDGNITYVNHWIRTDKYNYEKKTKRELPLKMGSLNNPYMLLLSVFYKLFESIGLLPNFMGTANTALWQNNNHTYALHERDVPYEIDINFNDTSISTIKKLDLLDVKHFTAHPHSDDKNIYAISYDNILPITKILKYDKNMNLIKEKIIITKYKSIVHDFVLTNSSIIFCDMPFTFNLTRILDGKMPFYFDKSKNVRFSIISKDMKNISWIEMESNFFIFHFDNAREDDDYIYFNGIIYDDFEMDVLTVNRNNYMKNHPKYMRFIIDKKNNSISMIKNKDFEDLNLEFPNELNNTTVLSLYNDQLNTIGFIISENYELKKTVYLKNRKIFAEPSIIEVDKNKYVICFVYDTSFNSYLNIYDVNLNKNIEIKLDDIKINKGFHSIFIKNN